MKALLFDDLEERMNTFFNTEIKTHSTGHLNIDRCYKFISSGVTDITGYPYMGKTLVLNEFLWNVTMKTGMKNLMHLPDSGKPEEVIAHLIQKDSGKTFYKNCKNTITQKEITQHLYRVTENFHLLELEKSSKGRLKRPTPKEFWEFAIKEGYHTANIDSWNYMKHESSGTEYLADVLSYRNELADNNSIHFNTIIHPKNPTKDNYDSNGNLKHADQYCLMGGSEWNNNMRNGISVHKQSKESDEYEIHILKTKPRIVGKTGLEELIFDRGLQRFYTNGHGKRIYAYGEELKFEEKKETGFEKVISEEVDFDNDTGETFEKITRMNEKGELIEEINPFLK